MVRNKSTFRLFVQEKSHVSSSANSLGIIETEQTRDISDNVFMGGFSTSPTTTISEAELKWAKATEDFSLNVFMRKMGKFISQAKLAKPKATSHKRPQNKLVRKVSTSATETISIQSTAELASTKATTDIPITLFVRMAGKLPDHRHRYLCDLFRTTVLYWPSSYGKIVLVLDDEARQDHEFGDKIISETKKYFPDRKLEVLYEALPKHRSTLNFPGSPKSPGYNRQLWSSFFIDLYSNDSVIAWMDTDAAFFTPVTKSSIFHGTKLRVLGTGCTFKFRSWVHIWARTTELALGLPFVVDSMTYFPVYIYRDTFTNCREHILKRFKTRNFEKAFRKFYNGFISPVSVILSYAWYFERDRYDWNLEICDDLSKYNTRFPNGHTIGPEHVVTILSEPQTAFHGHPGNDDILTPKILASYCLSHKAAGNMLSICSNVSVSLSTNLVFLKHDLQDLGNRGLYKKPCIGNNLNKCLQVLEHYYNQVGFEIKQGRRKLEWHNVETAEMLASEFDMQCPSIRQKPLKTNELKIGVKKAKTGVKVTRSRSIGGRRRGF